MDEDKRTYLVVGLGNPGQAYRGNRHNVGFMVADRVAENMGLSFSSMERESLVASGRVSGRKIILAKPQTYMNRSGQSVSSLVRFYKLPLDHLLVAYDDVDLPFESLRLRPAGGAGGQKGVKSIIRSLGTEAFARLRVGVGRPPGRMSVSSYVLRDFTEEEREALAYVLDEAAEAVLTFITAGIDQAMTRHNYTPEE